MRKLLLVFQVFDWDSFVDVIRHYCQPHIFKPDLVPNILSSASVFISFVKDAEEDVETPCWVQLDVLAALEQAKGVNSSSLQYLFI